MKDLFIGNSVAWLRLGAAILALAIASKLAVPSGSISLASLPKPGSVHEW